MVCNQYDVSTDKIILAVGEKTIVNLIGLKNGDDLLGTTDKNITLFGDVIVNLLGTTDKIVDLIGTKYIDDLTGTKYIDNLSGLLDKNVYLIADGACSGWWYILVDTTLFTVDNTIVTVDRL